jgi:probable rRNA maturation factor
MGVSLPKARLYGQVCGSERYSLRYEQGMTAQIITRDSVRKLVNTKIVQARLTAMLRAAKWVNGTAPKKPVVSALLTDDGEIHELNRNYRKKNKPTDVLAFAMHEGEFGHLAGSNLGDLAISVETAKRQCAEHKLSLLDEITTLAAHGLLHLLGWDHNTDAEEAAMNRATADLVSAALRTKAPTRPKLAKKISKRSKKEADKKPTRSAKPR